MKKLALLLALMAASVTAWADSFEVGNLKYELSFTYDSKNYATCTGLSTAGQSASSLNLNIPYIVSYGGEKYYVLYIGENAFSNCTNINSVRMYYGISRILENAFYGCSSMKSVRIPSSVMYFQKNAFGGCSNLDEVYYASLITPTGGWSNSFSSSITRKLYVPWGANVDDFSNHITFSSSNFASIENSSNAWDYRISDGTLCIVTENEFASDTGEVTIIGFDNTVSNTNVSNGIYKPLNPQLTISYYDKPFNYVAVAEKAFFRNDNLKQLDLSNLTSLRTIGERAAAGCYSLTSVSLPCGEIADNAFNSCVDLTNLSLGNVTSIGYDSFNDCYALTSVTIPASTTSLKHNSFSSCTSLAKFIVASDNPVYSSVDGIIYDKAQTTLFSTPSGYTGTFATIPSTVKTIGYSSCYSCNKITIVDIPYGVETIGKEAFLSCEALETVSIPSSVKELGSRAFAMCNKLFEIFINTNFVPEYPTDFVKGKLTPFLYTQRGMENAFMDAGWTDFQYIITFYVGSDLATDEGLCYTVSSTEPVTIDDVTYDGRAKMVRGRTSLNVKGELNIPPSITLAGKQFAVTKIDSLAFYNRDSNSFSLTGAACVDSIEYQAFYNRNITSIETPRVKYIGQYAFNNTNIQRIDLPCATSNIRLEPNSFTDATQLKEVVVRHRNLYARQAFGNNDKDFTFYVPQDFASYAYLYHEEYQYDETTSYVDHLGVCFYADNTTRTFAVATPLDFAASGVNAYAVTGYNTASNVAITTKCNQNAREEGVLLTDLVPGDFYKIIPYNKSLEINSDNHLVPFLAMHYASTDLLSKENAYYWDTDNLKWVRPSERYYVPGGEAYLVMPGHGSNIYIDLFPGEEVMGDLNGDGIVDITDVNMCINMVLGKVTKTTAADINGDGDVDITDVNLVINLMLGK